MSSMLTTIDNPFNPFTQWDEWFAFDQHAGYNTPGFLARILITSNDLSDSEQEEAIDDAINEIVEENVLGIYKKVTNDESESLNS